MVKQEYQGSNMPLLFRFMGVSADVPKIRFYALFRQQLSLPTENLGEGDAMNGNAQAIPYDPARSSGRQVWLKRKNGDLVGGNYRIPKGDFGRFLGYRAPSSAEQSGKKVSANRVLEVAMQKSFRELGAKAMQRGAAYRNLYVAAGRRSSRPGSEGSALAEGMDAIQQSLEVNKASNMQYLEMQYKFQWASKSFGVISNIMKTRHESTKKSISEVR